MATTSKTKKKQTAEKSDDKKITISKNLIIGICGAIVAVIVVVLICMRVEYESRPPEVDIRMSDPDGYISDILEDFDLDFDEVTAGANCFTGVQEHEYDTDDYGVLHVDFSYCASSETESLHIYNDEDDQPLREAKDGEIPTYTSSGYRIEL